MPVHFVGCRAATMGGKGENNVSPRKTMPWDPAPSRGGPWAAATCLTLGFLDTLRRETQEHPCRHVEVYSPIRLLDCNPEQKFTLNVC